MTQPRDRHIRRNPSGFHPTTPPPDSRPYRRAFEGSGSEMRTMTLSATQTWRQIGWHGQTGAFYALDEQPSLHEPGSISPLWLLVDNEPPVTDAGAGA
ncbi:hypothetical protein LHJ74_14530 [Streptomyces sp. N2-109]|uniref:Uncharacterized protein n=1 Tax=Streptomyces gossypii TaxID=2883101 RepID=A0ABT2JTA6_9ACTN|nr:hypothetical protein [Streptomyces gossypii]MCT2591110.1 hypothetical protein [Streptomyces gossypii]